ncbi:hypothetical protein PF008_g30525 [Phytophthora fragariae]|uniref:Uncharacterized protein n=1 Tax=Phytophthora fragariae TaxID=53985 RepID=A0A6G0Q594_9STRA|nr:hypothetical protein PF008_g30525 [Phytophthora fragariae]
MLPGHTDTSFAAGVAPLNAHNLKQSNAPDKPQVVYQPPLSDAQTTLVQHTVDAIQLVARPVGASPNELDSDAFIAEARAVAQRTASKITAIQGE